MNAEVTEKAVKKAGFTHDNKENVSADWYTPPWIFEELGLSYDLDPCSPPGGIPWIPAKRHYTKEDDGLVQPWEGRVWLNPPYGKWTGPFLEKMHNHRNGVALVFARTDCRWFHDYAVRAHAILFLKGRVKFVDGLGLTGGGGAGAGSMLIAWGEECVEALAGMSNRGLFIELGY